MAKAFAKSFYNSAAWKKTSKAYASSKFYLCEKCGHEGYIVHHIKHLTLENINNPEITLDWDNLMYLCLECHNKIHGKQNERNMFFDEDGNMIGFAEKNSKNTPL